MKAMDFSVRNVTILLLNRVLPCFLFTCLSAYWTVSRGIYAREYFSTETRFHCFYQKLIPRLKENVS
jgi:hypothetical protein